jgi:hypothetical protein
LRRSRKAAARDKKITHQKTSKPIDIPKVGEKQQYGGKTTKNNPKN